MTFQELRKSKMARTPKTVSSLVQIEDVRLREGSFRSFVRPADAGEEVSVREWREAKVEEVGDDGSLCIGIEFRMKLCDPDVEEEVLKAEVRGVFELAYRIPAKETFTDAELAEFSNVNAVFNAWPYWREFVQAALGRMSMPSYVLPVYRVPRRRPPQKRPNSNVH